MTEYAWLDEIAAFSDPLAHRRQEGISSIVSSIWTSEPAPSGFWAPRRSIRADEYGRGSGKTRMDAERVREDLTFIASRSSEKFTHEIAYRPRQNGKTGMAPTTQYGATPATLEKQRELEAAIARGEPIWMAYYPINWAVELPTCGYRLNEEQRRAAEEKFGIKVPEVIKVQVD